MRPYYEDYVNHMLRHYCRYGQADSEATENLGGLPSDKDELAEAAALCRRNQIAMVNYAVCDGVLGELEQSDRELILAVYSSDGWYDARPSLYQIMRSVGVQDTHAAIRLIKSVSVRIKDQRGL